MHLTLADLRHFEFRSQRHVRNVDGRGGKVHDRHRVGEELGDVGFRADYGDRPGPIAFEGDGHVCEYIGGYDDWLQQRPQPKNDLKPKQPLEEKPKKERARKLTFKEKQEVVELPLKIEALETEVAQLHTKMADPDFYRTAGAQVAATTARLEMIEAELVEVYARWEELETLSD